MFDWLLGDEWGGLVVLFVLVGCLVWEEARAFSEGFVVVVEVELGGVWVGLAMLEVDFLVVLV